LRSRPCGEGRYEHLWCRSPIADRGVWPDGVVVPPPALDDDLRLPQRVEDFPVEQLVAQASVEALDEAVLPWAASFNVGGPCTDGSDPVLHGFGDELGSVVGADVFRDATQDEEIDIRSITSMDLSLRATRIARHSWVNSSMMLSMRILRPS